MAGMIHPSTTGAIAMKRVAIYLRVSTSKQETGNQRRELEAVAVDSTKLYGQLLAASLSRRCASF